MTVRKAKKAFSWLKTIAAGAISRSPMTCATVNPHEGLIKPENVTSTTKEVEQPGTPDKECDLLILDTAFPHSTFRSEEFCSYLGYFKNAVVLSTGEVYPVFKETRTVAEVLSEFECRHPEFKGRTGATTSSIEGYHARLAYLVFLDTATQCLPSLENNKIPFVFTLYPGGGFGIGEPESDCRLRRIFESPQFRKVIVTQRVTYDYLIDNGLCPAEHIEFIYGVVTPVDPLNKCQTYTKTRYGFEKTTLDICFVARKYMEKGIDKGYDMFIEIARKLADSHSDTNFHVVGNYDETDIPINGLEGRITFHGLQPQEWFDRFYTDKDLILSPNVPFKLKKGSFDGFPTASCTEAGLRKVALFCTDELKLNTQFTNGKEIVIIPYDVDKIVSIIENYRSDPAKLRDIGEKGAARILEIYCHENQIMPRLKILEKELRNLSGENRRG